MTIRLKLTFYWAAVLTAIVLAAGVAVLVLFERQQWGQLDGALMEEADTAASTIARMDNSSRAALIRNLSEERDLGPGRRVVLISGGRAIADFGSPSADLPVVRGGVPLAYMDDGSRKIFRFAMMPLKLGGRDAWLEDGVDAAALRNSIARLKTSLLALLPLLLMVSVSCGYWLAGRALVPIGSLAAALAEIDPRDLSRRLALDRDDDEVARLTRALNALLDRVERASNAERRFAADAAHELRTPLTVLRTGLEVALGRGRTATEYTGALDTALRETVALCRMADELLTLSRLDRESSIERAPVNLSALVREVAEAVEPLVQARNLTVRTDLDGDVFVDGNRDHLHRVLINLLDNALKFTPEHGHVSVGLEASSSRAILRVTDTGPGIPPDDLPFIFDRFFRGKSRGEHGSGLGLSLCREIVRLHGGEISAANAMGGGSEFVVVLPASKPVQA